jgi:SOS-response transcriptional repressor LexA
MEVDKIETLKPTAPAAKTLRPTKKQQELLGFIENFINQYGYSPSYREIMKGLNYTSVATVSLHVNNLIRRGHLQKRDRSARSLEVVKPEIKPDAKVVPKQLKAAEEKWLVEKIEIFFKEAEAAPAVAEAQLDHLYVLIGALKVLGVEGAANAFIARLSELKKRVGENEYVV